MSVVTKRSSKPVAALAITLLTAILPAQCEKLSTVLSMCTIGFQTVLHTSSGSIRWYQSDDTWLHQLWVNSQCCLCREKSVKVRLRITHFVYRGTPRWLSAQREGLPQTAQPKRRPPGTLLTVRWPGACSCAVTDVTAAGISRTSWCHFCFLWSAQHALIVCVYVCLGRQTGCDRELQGVSWPREESTWPQVKKNNGANSTKQKLFWIHKNFT